MPVSNENGYCSASPTEVSHTNMQVRVIVNPISGRGSLAQSIKRLGELLSERGCDIEVTETQRPGHAAQLAAETPESYRAIVVAGGDGTIRDVVRGMIHRSIPLTVLPGGTENVLARHFGFLNDAKVAADAVTNGQLIHYDVGQCGEDHFILMVSCGVDADIVHRLAQRRRGHISYASYVIPILQSFIAYDYPPLSVSIDGETVFEGRALVWVGVIPRYSLGIHILSRANTDDGLLDTCIIPCSSRWQAIACARRLLSGTHLNVGNVQYHQSREVAIESADSEAPVTQVDGDPSGRLPVKCSIIPRGVRFLIPANNSKLFQ